MHSRLFRRAFAVPVIAALAATGCASGGNAARHRTGLEKKDLVVLAVPAEGAAGLYIAQDDGLFARAGLHVTIKSTADTSADIPALLHGRVDVLSGQYTTYIAADATGVARMRILAAGYALGPDVQEIMTRTGSRIRSVPDLKGATIAVNAVNSVTTDLLYATLAPYGVTQAEVHVLAVPFPAMPAALASGRVTAIYEVEPYVTEAAENDGDTAVIDIDGGATLGFPINGYGVLAAWAAKYPNTAAAFARAIQQGNTIAQTNPTARQRAIQTSLHLPKEVTEVMAAGTYPTALEPRQIQRVANLMLRYGQLRRSFSVAPIIGP
jgi:NitT/TauT family transport system substrate-binding protein